MTENIALTANDEKQAVYQKCEEDTEEREEWGNKLDFILSCVGYAVGFGNVWRFPNLCFENGGGAFLIPYFFFLIICGIPLFFMELSLSQYIGLAPISCWKALSPMFQGIGFAMLTVSFLVCVYYNAIIAWIFYYLFESFRSDVPWRNCNNAWNTEECYNGPPTTNGTIFKNITDPLTNLTTMVLTCADKFGPVFKNISTSATNTTVNTTGVVLKEVVGCKFIKPDKPVLPSEEYMVNYVFEQSGGIQHAGEVKWELCLCLLLAWIVVYFCIFKGVKSVGKVVYVTATFPYIVLFILLIRGATLPGSWTGVKYFLNPIPSKLLDPNVWMRAASQIFYSLGVGFGSLIAMGSYNKFNNNCYRDAVMVASINCASSVFCGFVVFSVLGNLALVLDIPIDKVAQAGPGLVFVVYPAGISQMPISPLWSILFFLMLLTIGLDSQFAMMECVISSLSDEYPRYLRKYKEFFTMGLCIVAFLLGIPTVLQAGPYIVELFNTQTGGVSLLFLAFFEVIVVGWVYGADRLLNNVETMIGYKPCRYWYYCWKFISPIVIFVVFLSGVIQWKGVRFGTYTYPPWAEGVGWMLALCSMVCIPIGIILAVVKARKTQSYSPDGKQLTNKELFFSILMPDEERLKEIEMIRNKDDDNDLRAPIVA